MALPKAHGTPILTASPATCGFINFLYFSMHSISALILILISLQRCVALHFPYRASSFNTRQNYTVLLVIGCLVIVISYLPLTFTLTNSIARFDNYYLTAYCDCQDSAFSRWYTKTFVKYVNLAFSCLIPFAFISGFNLAIIYGITRLKTRDAVSRRRDRGRIILLISISVTFIILTLPYPVHYILIVMLDKDSPSRRNVALFGSFAALAASLNHSVNIFIYCLCGRTFRRCLVKMLKGYVVRIPHSLPVCVTTGRKVHEQL